MVPDIFLFIFFGNGDTLAIWLKLMLNNFPICIVFDTEGMVQNTCNIVLTGKEREGKILNWES